MGAALAGDRAAYHRLLSCLRPWLAAYFVKRVHRDVVDDLVQEALMSVHAKRQTYDPARPFGPWVAAVARHRWIDYMRKNLKIATTELDESYMAPEETSHPAARYDLERLFVFIPDAQADVIRLVKLEEKTIAEAAAQTGHSESSVKVMIHRGLKKMQKAVKEAANE